jgi:hypothetical protein
MLSTSFPKDKKKTVLHLQNARRTAFFVIITLNQEESRSNILTENTKWNNKAIFHIKKQKKIHSSRNKVAGLCIFVFTAGGIMPDPWLFESWHKL